MRRIAKLLLDWYANNARVLPWRVHNDPYAVWVSEIMLQQTRVETVIPYFNRWMNIFPSISVLALSTESEVLAVWEGLGYYGRARNLLKASKVVMHDYDGKLPGNLRELIKLPGIGRYTAGAIASIAFKMDVTTLDGNISRVFSRLFDLQDVAESREGRKKLWGYLAEELPKGFAGDFNQALMDLGSTICTPKSPYCDKCPMVGVCVAKTRNIQFERPIKKINPVQPSFTFVCAIIQRKDKFLLTRNASNGLLGGLWDFPNDKVKSDENDLDIEIAGFLSKNFGENVKMTFKQDVISHSYTHYRLKIHVYWCIWNEENIDLSDKYFWVPRNELMNYPMGKVARQISWILIADENLRL